MGSKRTAYIESFVNLVPFDSIALYVRGYLNGYVGLYYTVINLLGNTCVFMPLAAFLALAPFAFPAPRRKDKDDGEES